MTLSPLFKEVVFGLAKGTVGHLGNVVLPGAWPILEKALEPVLERLRVKFVGGDEEANLTKAQKAVQEFEKDKGLQELWRTSLVEQLEPLIAGHETLEKGQRAILLAVTGNTEMLDGLLKGVHKRFDEFDDKLDDIRNLIVNSAGLANQTRQYARRLRQSWVPRRLVEDRIQRIQTLAIDMIQKGHIGNALAELQMAEIVLGALLEEAPTDVHLKIQQGYLYKNVATALDRCAEKKEAEQYLSHTLEVCELLKQDLIGGAEDSWEKSALMTLTGNVASMRGDQKSALANYQEAVRLSPDFASAWHDMFLAYLQLAKKGDTHLQEMRHALNRLKQTSANVPIIAQSIPVFQRYLQEFEQSPG
jgi:tetratricopeptide (TPR) repeat protein